MTKLEFICQYVLNQAQVVPNLDPAIAVEQAEDAWAEINLACRPSNSPSYQELQNAKIES